MDDDNLNNKKENPVKSTSKFPTRYIIMIALAVVVLAVAASVIVTINQNQPILQPTQEETSNAPSIKEATQSEPSKQEEPKGETFASKVPVELAEEKRIFTPTQPKKLDLPPLTQNELAAREAIYKKLAEDRGIEYIPIDSYNDARGSPILLDVALNPKGKAAIIDMLWDKLPNRDFLQKSNDLLAQGGYSVDIYLTNDATVDFYKKLPSMNYDYVIWRTHGLAQGAIEKSATIYTGEIWESGKYYNEQLAGQIHFGYPYTPAEVEEIGWQNLRDETFYTIGHAFVENAMEGKFNDSIILIGGCDALSGNLLADSFIKKGASIVIGWTDIIGADENDDAMLLVLEELLIDETIPEYAAKNASEKLSKHPMFDETGLAFRSKNI